MRRIDARDRISSVSQDSRNLESTRSPVAENSVYDSVYGALGEKGDGIETII